MTINLIERKDVYKGHKYQIKIHPTLAHRCGYVFIKNDLISKDDDFYKIKIDVHGGITYDEKQGTTRTIGFDCGHWIDRPDFDSAIKFYKGTKYEKSLIQHKSHMLPFLDGEIRSLEFCENECKKIIDQIIKLTN